MLYLNVLKHAAGICWREMAQPPLLLPVATRIPRASLWWNLSLRCCHRGDASLSSFRNVILSLIASHVFELLLRNDVAAAAVTVATCGTVLLLLIAAQSSSSECSASRNVPFKLCERALELLRDVDAKSMMPLHIHAQVMILLIAMVSQMLIACVALRPIVLHQLAAAAHGVMSDKYLSRGLSDAGRREAEKAVGAIRCEANHLTSSVIHQYFYHHQHDHHHQERHVSHHTPLHAARGKQETHFIHYVNHHHHMASATINHTCTGAHW